MSGRGRKSSDYEVGYGRPPIATRFAVGNRANPNGRPRDRTGPHSWDQGSLNLRCNLRLPLSFKYQAASCCFCCGYVGNAFALSKRSGISTALAATSILSMPARHTAIGIWLFIAW